jgi:hypothetical protein
MTLRSLSLLVTSLLVGCATRTIEPAAPVAAEASVLACGNGESLAIDASGHLVRGGGEHWTRVATPSTHRLRALWGTSCKDVWAVGDYGTIVWGDGRDFWIVPSPTTMPLDSVHGSTHDDVSATTVDGTVLRFDGTTWKAEPQRRNETGSIASSSTSPPSL